ncbi:MAG: hypothetical protein A4E67_01060 [Syntrophaceae bacterium PtaB.Bin038]|nr:MAG: hypothetical protein A4E67_01060 [Syntrophaceae bacterium PtaB.Bin038]
MADRAPPETGAFRREPQLLHELPEDHLGQPRREPFGIEPDPDVGAVAVREGPQVPRADDSGLEVKPHLAGTARHFIVQADPEPGGETQVFSDQGLRPVGADEKPEPEHAPVRPHGAVGKAGDLRPDGDFDVRSPFETGQVMAGKVDAAHRDHRVSQHDAKGRAVVHADDLLAKRARAIPRHAESGGRAGQPARAGLEADGLVFLEQQDAEARARKRLRAGDPRRTGANDDHVKPVVHRHPSPPGVQSALLCRG